ncbi:MAG TPA: pYEATS domain-containing protein [Chryseosolibacter sp.]
MILPESFPAPSALAEANKLEAFYSKYVDEFYPEYKFGHFIFAAYCAVPALLTPDLLYKIRQNFYAYQWDGEHLAIHPIAVADVLTSPICRQVGHELFEMHQDIRASFLRWLTIAPASVEWHDIGLRKIEEIAAFVLNYYETPGENTLQWGPDHVETQRLEALFYLQPHKAAQKLFAKFLNIEQRHGETKLLRTIDQVLKTRARLETYLDPAHEILKILNDQSGMVEAWKNVIEENGQSFASKIKIDESLHKLLKSKKTAGALEVKVPESLSPEPLLPGKRRVLIIGVGSESNKSDVDTARLFERTIRPMLPADAVVALVAGEDATKAGVYEKLRSTFAEANSYDDLIIYIAADGLAAEGHCYARMRDSRNFNLDPSGWLKDDEIGSMAVRSEYKSLTLIVQVDHASTPYWFDTSDESNTLFASCMYLQKASTLVLGDERQCLFTVALTSAMKEIGLGHSNLQLFLRALRFYKELSVDVPGRGRENIFENKTPMLLCHQSALHHFFAAGPNVDVDLQVKLIQTGYENPPIDPDPSDKLSNALRTFGANNNINTANLSKRDFLLALEAQANAAKPIFLLIFADAKRGSLELPRERTEISGMLTRFTKQNGIELFILNDPSQEEVITFFSAPSRRNRIQLCYFSGFDDDGALLFRDGNLSFVDFGELLLYQGNLKLFVANTCRSETLVQYLQSWSVPHTIGVRGEISDHSGAEFGIHFFSSLIVNNDVKNFLDSLNQSTSYQNIVYINNLSFSFNAPEFPSWKVKTQPLNERAVSESRVFLLSIGVDELSLNASSLRFSSGNAKQFSEMISQVTARLSRRLGVNRNLTGNVTRNKINGALSELSQLQDGDHCIVFLSGATAGDPASNRTRFFLFSDDHPDVLLTQGFDPVAELQQVIGNKNVMLVLIVDSHYDLKLRNIPVSQNLLETFEGHFVIIENRPLSTRQAHNHFFSSLIHVLRNASADMTYQLFFDQVVNELRLQRQREPLDLPSFSSDAGEEKFLGYRAPGVGPQSEPPVAEPVKFIPAHLFRTMVQEQYAAREVVEDDDLQKGRWGLKSDYPGRASLTAEVRRFGSANYEVRLIVKLRRQPINNEEVAIFLHDSFADEIRFVTFDRDGKAEVTVRSFEAFTAAAYLMDELSLELDLNEVPNLPKGFYYKKVSDSFRKKVEKLYQSRPVIVADDLQKKRWGDTAWSNNKKITASIKNTFFARVNLYKVVLEVRSTDDKSLVGDIAFFLHDTFTKEIKFKKFIDGVARLTVRAYEAFTVGAYTSDGTMLELDLNEVPGGPPGFYYEVKPNAAEQSSSSTQEISFDLDQSKIVSIGAVSNGLLSPPYS